MTRKPPFCHHLVSYDRRLSGIIVAVAVMLLPTVSVVAQDASEEQNKHDVRVGVYFSFAGIGSNIDFSYDNDIFSAEDDSMPYPGTHISIGYNRYQGIVAWNNDDNESISKFIMRYNYYPFKKDIYVFGGIIVWRFNKKFSYRRYMDPNLVYEIKTDRPDGKSMTPGINVGFGIEYKPRNLIWSHEIELNFSNCKYKEFICGRWPDLKLLGLHLEF